MALSCPREFPHPHWLRFVPFFFWRLHLPLTLSFRLCRCGRPLDCAVCSRASVLGRRGFAVESAAARVCREVGGRVTLNTMGQGHGWLFRTPTTLDGWKLSQTVCHCFVAHNWQSCPRCTRWLSETWCCSQGRCSSRRGQAQEGAHFS